jgi:hypothetical protein
MSTPLGALYHREPLATWHMRLGELIRWDVDQLTDAGRVTGAWVFPKELAYRTCNAPGWLPRWRDRP